MPEGERFNIISHAIGGIFSLVALGALLAVGIQSGNVTIIFSFGLFGTTMALMYAMSVLYHSVPPGDRKQKLQILDHIAIYLLIAGTYTPYSLVSLPNDGGGKILAMVWALALVGIASEIFLSGRIVKTGQLLIYLAMGWLGASKLDILQHAIAGSGITWLITGGVAYTIGVIFYLLYKADKLEHAHGYWHLCVVAGTVCHFISVVGYVR